MIRFFVLWALVIGAALPTVARAQAKEDANALANQINGELSNADAAQQQKGITDLRHLMQIDASRAAAGLRTGWLKQLETLKQYDVIDELAPEVIVASAQDVGAIEAMLTARIHALLAAGKADKAVANCKALFDVCALPSTSGVMVLMAECLNTAHPGDDTFTERFRSEQMEGATYPPPGAPHQPMTPAALLSPPPATRPVTLLSEIHVDAKEYEAAIKRLTAEDFATLIAKANLLMLSGRAHDAQGVLERAYAMGNEGQLQQAAEGISRCIKAEDGNIGRANVWVASLHPRK